MRESKLRLVGSRRNSVRDIKAMRDKEVGPPLQARVLALTNVCACQLADQHEKHAALVKLLKASSHEELVEEVIFLRRKVERLEQQLAEHLASASAGGK